jgi:imidazolonepropionase-like amidohydrolase
MNMILTILFALASALSAETIVLRHANVIDGVSNEPIRGATIILRDARIESIGRDDQAGPAGATTLDLAGKWVLPGYVDAHVHISNLRDARRALLSGTTTVRSMGVSNYADVGMRELHRKGMNDIPEFIASGYHVRPHPAEEMFFDFPSLFDLMQGVHGTENVRRLVKANLDHGVQVIKILATERAGTPDTDPRKRTFTDDEIAASIDEAKSHGIPVAAHAHGEEGAAAAVRAGVHSIEHGTYLSDATLEEMKRRGVYLDPTIATVIDLMEPGGDYDDPVLSMRGQHMLPRVREMAQHAVKIGVKIVAGTDTAYAPRSIRRIPHEIVELVGIGMSPMDAIKAGTSASAECLGIANRTGSLQPGKEADLIVIERDPLTYLTALQDVLVVINDGTIVVNRLKW